MTETPDRWQALRDALDGIVTSGPWGWDEQTGHLVCTGANQVPGDPFEVIAWDDGGVWCFADDADYIATADPTTVGALLAERDALLALVREPAPGPCLSPCPASPGLPLWCELRWGHKGGHEATNTDGSRAAWTEPS